MNEGSENFDTLQTEVKNENEDLQDLKQNSSRVRKKTSLKSIRTKKFSCNLCDKSYYFKDGLNLHCKVAHTDFTGFSCDLCSKKFKHSNAIKKHWDLDHNPLNLFSCRKQNCNIRCKSLISFNIHLRKEHDPLRHKNPKSLQCHKCQKTFETSKQLMHHSYIHREKLLVCDHCGAKFNNRSTMENHLLRHVGLYSQKVKQHHKIVCDQCSMMVFPHKIKRHQLIHHTEDKPFKCEIAECSAAFSDKRTLLDHKNIHFNLKPYKCEHCPEAFRSSANLRLHRVRHTDPDR